MSKDSKTHYSIVARPKAGFRRAGHFFLANKPTVISADDLSPDQIVQLKAEPNLVVVETGGEAAPVKTNQAAAFEADLKAEKQKTAALQKELATNSKELEVAHKELAGLKTKLADSEKELAALQKKTASADDKKAGNSR